MKAADRLLPGFCLCLALWPLLVVHLAYGLAIWQDHVPACVPYIDGCTSISRAGRHGLANYLFKAGLLPYTAMLALFWWLARYWLLEFAERGVSAMVISGSLGALFLVLYLTFLGSEGQGYQLMRRYGIYVYFGGTYIGQLLFTGQLYRLGHSWMKSIARLKLSLGLLMLGFGLITVAAYELPVDKDRLQNAMEWCAALAMQLYFLLTAWLWQVSGFKLRFTSSQ